MRQTDLFSSRLGRGIFLPIGIGLVAVIGIVVSWLGLGTDERVALAIIAVSVLLPILAVAIFYKPAILWWGAMLCLAFLTSEPLDPQVRAGFVDSPDYNLFGRYIFGIIATWDILVLALLAFLFVTSAISNKTADLAKRMLANRPVRLYAGLLLFAILVGCAVILINQFHVFVFRDWARAVMPIFYLLSAYFLVVNLIRTREDFRRTWWLLQVVAFLMVLFGLYRLQGILSGQIKTFWPFGIPLVLYSEMVVFDLPILVYCLTLWIRGRLNILQWLLLVAMIGYILGSTRRFNYILLAMNFGIAFFLGHKAGLFTLKQALLRSWALLFMGIGAGIVALNVAPDLLPAVTESIETILFFTGKGFEYTGEFRLGEISGIFANLTNLPFTWLIGFGIGTKWRVFTDLPWGIDQTGGNMAFDAKVLAGGSAWLPFFHVPYFATLFRFGLLGILGLITVTWSLLRGYVRMIRMVSNKSDQVVLVALLTLTPMTILVLGDSPTPTGYIWLAIYLGLLESYRLTTASVPRGESESA